MSRPTPSRDLDRARSLGRELRAVHDQLRTELARARAEFDNPAGGPATPRSLRTHCAAFCVALTRHHTGEDIAAFPLLAAQFPELAPVLSELQADHGLVADIVRRLDGLLNAAANRDTVHRELDGLAAILESHFRWEERRLVRALDALDRGDRTTDELLGIDAPR
ncbi:hemerythrin domain-containing protein [Nocardia brasiliensis]|uniref:hemerythrin domain-containing protein n=1 Tax=Nocardia brasiliensis TaxID=37326 RepID=UPI0037B3BDF9